jgi:hypothetical protein
VTAPAPIREHGLALYGAARAELLLRCERAVRRARRAGGGVLAGLTVRVGSGVDPSAVVFASRRTGDEWFCLEQPDRDGAALAALGCATALEEHGPERFARVARRWSALAAAARCDAPDAGPGTGLVAVGGFAFAHEGGASRHWRNFPPAS